MASLLQTKGCLPQGRAGSCRKSQHLPDSRVSGGPEGGSMIPSQQLQHPPRRGYLSWWRLVDRAVITALQKFLILLIGACSNTLGLIPLSLDFRPPSSLENPASSLRLTRLSSCRQDYDNLPMRPTLQGCSQGKSLQFPGKLPQGRPRASPGVPWRPLISHSRTLNGPCTPA